jgi:hypothetical protein
MEIWTSILATAIHAPSPHNVQPWRVKIIDERQALLYIDNSRTLPKEDLTGSFIILTMGLFLEALTLLAANRGHKLTWNLEHAAEWFADAIVKHPGDHLLSFARLTLSPDSDATSVFDESLFFSRRTSRLSLFRTPVPEPAQTALRSIAAAWGQRYEQIQDPTLIERLLQCNTDAVFEDLNNADYHDEIVSWFRFTDRDSKRTRDGLDYRCMNTSRISFWLAARFPKLLQVSLFRPLFEKQYRAQAGVVPTIGMLAGDFWQPDAALNTGRFLMRFWFETAMHGLYIHPYGNLVTNKKAADWCREQIGVDGIWLIFKIGFSEEPPKSHRRSVEEVLVA